MEDPKKTAKQIAAQDQELAAHFTRLFNTSDGQVVLGNLNTQFLINRVGPGQDHAYHMGQKDLMNYILLTIQQGQSGLKGAR